MLIRSVALVDLAGTERRPCEKQVMERTEYGKHEGREAGFPRSSHSLGFPLKFQPFHGFDDWVDVFGTISSRTIVTAMGL